MLHIIILNNYDNQDKCTDINYIRKTSQYLIQPPGFVVVKQTLLKNKLYFIF